MSDVYQNLSIICVLICIDKHHNFFGCDAVLLDSLLLILQGKIHSPCTLYERKKSKLLGRIGCNVQGKNRSSNGCSLVSGIEGVVGLAVQWVQLVRVEEME
jgi:hypothetical protein